MSPTRGITFLFALTVAACSGAPERDASRTSSSHQAIVGGSQDTSADDAVVFLDLGQGSFCTGTLVTPNLVLTARHCLQNLDETKDCGDFSTSFTPSSISVSLGVQAATKVAKGKQIFVETQANSCGFDIGLLLLDQDVPNAKVANVRTTALQTGEAARTAGYGDNGSGTPTSGRFVRTGLSVEGVGPNTFVWQTDQGQQISVPVAAGELVTGESTCFGDSGGPLFDAQGAIIGVTSRGVDQSCIDRPSIFSGMTTHVDLLNAAAKASGRALGSTASTQSTTPSTGNNTNNSNANNGSGDPGDDGSFEDDPSSSSNKSSSRANLSGNVASSGCSASARHSTDPVLAGVIVGAALLVLGRRRVRATSARTPV